MNHFMLLTYGWQLCESTQNKITQMKWMNGMNEWHNETQKNFFKQAHTPNGCFPLSSNILLCALKNDWKTFKCFTSESAIRRNEKCHKISYHDAMACVCVFVCVCLRLYHFPFFIISIYTRQINVYICTFVCMCIFFVFVRL